MHIWNTFLLVLRFWEIGSPSRVLIPCTCLLFAVLHGFLRWGTNGHGRWLPVLLTATILVCEVTIWLLHSYLAMLVVIGMCYAEAALLGTGLGELLYRLLIRKHSA
mgnify:CR=1 FL=1